MQHRTFLASRGNFDAMALEPFVNLAHTYTMPFGTERSPELAGNMASFVPHLLHAGPIRIKSATPRTARGVRGRSFALRSYGLCPYHDTYTQGKHFRFDRFSPEPKHNSL